MYPPLLDKICLAKGGFIMPKYDYDFKVRCIENYKRDHSLPEIKGMKRTTVVKRYLLFIFAIVFYTDGVILKID